MPKDEDGWAISINATLDVDELPKTGTLIQLTRNEDAQAEDSYASLGLGGPEGYLRVESVDY